MMNQSLGVTFQPNDENALTGPRQAGREGLQSAIQLLSFRYPKMQGARTPTGDPSLLRGNAPMRPEGFNPNAALLQALIQAMSGGGGQAGPMSGPMGQAPPGAPSAPAPVAKPYSPSFDFGRGPSYPKPDPGPRPGLMTPGGGGFRAPRRQGF